jgi:hypothetical protein
MPRRETFAELVELVTQAQARAVVQPEAEAKARAHGVAGIDHAEAHRFPFRIEPRALVLGLRP